MKQKLKDSIFVVLCLAFCVVIQSTVEQVENPHIQTGVAYNN